MLSYVMLCYVMFVILVRPHGSTFSFYIFNDIQHLT